MTDDKPEGGEDRRLAALKKALAEGKVTFAGTPPDPSKPTDETIEAAGIDPERIPAAGGFVATWQAKNFGFGEVTFYMLDGVLRCDSETMGRDFVKSVLCKLVDTAQFDGEKP